MDVGHPPPPTTPKLVKIISAHDTSAVIISTEPESLCERSDQEVLSVSSDIGSHTCQIKQLESTVDLRTLFQFWAS